MCEERYLVKLAQVTSLSGYTINVLLDLGNCFRVDNKNNTMSKENIQLFLDNAFANVRYFSETSRARYKQDLETLNTFVTSLARDTLSFSSICQGYFKLKTNSSYTSCSASKFLQ